jgi:hypothetical protein
MSIQGMITALTDPVTDRCRPLEAHVHTSHREEISSIRITLQSQTTLTTERDLMAFWIETEMNGVPIRTTLATITMTTILMFGVQSKAVRRVEAARAAQTMDRGIRDWTIICKNSRSP